ncbi:MAG TPA: hypothetical protein PK711_07295 [Bacteroidales bacterium]|nr:hypothetical protein [Bacteroidales bacterium]
MKIRISLLILFLGIYWAEAGAQIQSDTGYIIALTHLTKEKVKFIAPGKKITIWYGEGKVKGRLTAITPDNIFIDNSAYSPYQIIKIRALLPGTTAGGAVATAGGAGVLALGGYLAAISIIAITEAAGESWVIFWGTLGLLGSAPLIGLGAVLVPVGIIIITQGRAFDLVSKWRLSVIPME